MIDPDTLEAYISEQGPWLYHATPSANVQSILRDGLRPGSELARSNAPHPFHRTRPGRVYLWAAEQHERRRHKVGPATIRVDLRSLDPGLIDPDEDEVQGSFLPAFVGGTNDPWIETQPPLLDPGWKEGPNGEETLAFWAETTPGFDAAEIAAKSLARGRIAYRGTIPPEALTVAPWPLR